MFATTLALAISIIFIGFHDKLLRPDVRQNPGGGYAVRQNLPYYYGAFFFSGLAIYNSCAAIFRSMNNAKGYHVDFPAHQRDQYHRQCDLYFRPEMGVAGAAVPPRCPVSWGAIVIFCMMFNPETGGSISADRSGSVLTGI